MALSVMEGNEAISRAAIEAGCRFFGGYPIIRRPPYTGKGYTATQGQMVDWSHRNG